MKKTVLLVLVLTMLLGVVACSEELGPPTIDLGGGYLDQNYINNSTLEDIVASIPTKEGYVFAGWYSDAYFTDYISPQGLTATQKDANRAFAKWIEVKESATYNVRESEATITDSGRINQRLDQISLDRDYNLLDLQRAGYKKLSVTITMDIREIDDGYQHIFLYKDENCVKKDNSLLGLFDKYVTGDAVSEDKDPSCIYSYRHEHNPGEADVSWETLTFEASVQLSDLKDDLYIRYAGSGNDDDDWINKNVVVTVKPLR